MWQVLMAAAVAGSTTFVAKRFLSPGPAQPEEADESESSPPQTPPSQPRPESPDRGGGDGIFRFSSSGSSSRRKKKKKGKETGVGFAGRGHRATGRQLEDGGGGGRKFVVRLKRRRTSKGNSLFSWGIGVGMMCMVSAGKIEISKLSVAMSDTSKAVNELRTELCRRKVVRVMASSRFSSGASSGVGDTGDVRADRPPLSDDVECPSSVLTDEQEPEVLEMGQLEAELESELKKLPWSSNEASSNEKAHSNLDMYEASTNKFHELEEGRVAYQCHGVGPEELDKRLSHLLIEQQENQIVELESELHVAQSKLHEKDAELRSLKDCVRRLTQFSIASVSDDEDHEHEQQDFWSADGVTLTRSDPIQGLQDDEDHEHEQQDFWSADGVTLARSDPNQEHPVSLPSTLLASISPL